MDQKQLKAAWKKIQVAFEKSDQNPPDEFWMILAQASIDLNRIAQAVEDLERKTLP